MTTRSKLINCWQTTTERRRLDGSSTIGRLTADRQGRAVPGIWLPDTRSNPVSVQIRELYQSTNGDRWSLGHDSASGRVFVRHEPNLASGGKISDVDIGAFLSQGGQGPEKQELLRLIATLVEQDPPRPM